MAMSKEHPLQELSGIQGNPPFYGGGIERLGPNGIFHEFLSKTQATHAQLELNTGESSTDPRMKSYPVMICRFCKNNNRDESVYKCHVLRDAKGRVQCPVLRAYVCPICKATGDNAHTIKYCPKRKRNIPAVNTNIEGQADTYPEEYPGMICRFCKNNNLDESVYKCHVLRDAKGRVQCPILRAYVCPICKGTGDNAHTIKYCPKRKRNILALNTNID